MTAPFPLSVQNRLTSTEQASKWYSLLGMVREFRAYCCNIDANSIMGIAKEPVILADVRPNPVCVNTPIWWNISGSYAPGSTLTGWSVDFGDGTAPAGGANFPGDTTSGQHVYTAPGTYTIEIQVEEGLGKNQTSTVQVTVVECGEPIVGELWTYISTDGDGVYFIDWSEAVPAFIARNTGLSGPALFVRSMTMNPSTRDLNPDQHEIWIATQGGVFKTTNGGLGWAQIVIPDPSNLEFNDTPAATVDELDWHKVVFDPTSENTIYVLASKSSV